MPVGKKYKIIYSDPPWTYHVYSEKGRAGVRKTITIQWI